MLQSRDEWNTIAAVQKHTEQSDGGNNRMNEMSLGAVSQATAPAGVVKDLYESGEIPPLGPVPNNM